jgi:hypothetical protein
MELTDEPDFELAKALALAELNGARQSVLIGPFTAFCAIGALQLAWRHPELCNTPTGDRVRDLGEQLSAMFEPKVQDLLAKGWDRGHDKPWGGA